jgi:poly(A) polymerase
MTHAAVLLQFARMVTPRIVPRPEHTISRKDIDPDALKVLTRLRQFNHTAYLVGGSVRDLLLGRRPKDFDIGTSAHPYEVKRIFRNCWIVGRRFRLAHVRFGAKTIEVATFRRQVSDAELDAMAAAVPDGAEPAPPHDHLMHRDNTFGTPEEDAFRRDFTVNALFYDIASFAVIDYVGGIDDLHARLIRCIGEPDVRFREDPVRMLRAIVLAARLDFSIDPPILDSIRRNASEITRSAPARLMEELYKILRAGAAERAFRDLADVGLLEWIAPELLRVEGDALWRSLAELDAYRRRLEAPPTQLTNPVLLGTLLVPRGFSLRRPWSDEAAAAADSQDEETARPRRRPKPDFSQSNATLGVLPLARRDLERLRQLLSLQRRLIDLQSSARAKRGLTHRACFAEALTWLEVHGHAPDVLEHWRGFLEAAAPLEGDAAPADHRRRPRRRRGRRRSRFADGRAPR